MPKLCFFDTIDDSRIVNTFKGFVKQMVWSERLREQRMIDDSGDLTDKDDVTSGVDRLGRGRWNEKQMVSETR